MLIKKILLAGITLLFFAELNGQNIQSKIIGETYIIGDTSCVIRSFTFVSDTICEYNQDFFIDINEKFIHTKIICKYRVQNDKIILQNIDCPNYLVGLNQFDIPNYKQDVSKYYSPEIKKCYTYDTIFGYNTLNKKQYIKSIIEHTYRTKEYFISNLKKIQYWDNRYIDNINTIDTLSFINDCLVYGKIIEVQSADNIGLNVYYKKIVFENKNSPHSIEEKCEILKSKQANELLVVNGIPKNEEKSITMLYAVEMPRIDFLGKNFDDNYILNQNYKHLKKAIRKYKINVELQNQFFDNVICNFSYIGKWQF